MKRTNFILIFGGVFLLSGLYAGLGAQGKSVNDGVFTEAQVKRGDVLYKEQCATCHGDNLEGSGPMPALAGKDFLAGWQGKTVGDLFEKTHTTMPATAPGSLTPAQAAARAMGNPKDQSRDGHREAARRLRTPNRASRNT